MNSVTKKLQAGFTLVEILVVMVLIGILATISMGSFQSSQRKGRDAQRKSDLKQIGIALETYYNDQDQYPTSSGANKINGCSLGSECDWGDQFVDDNATTYMVIIPSDPRANTYYYDSDGTFYQIYARLENELDLDVPDSGGSVANYGISCGAQNCNYGSSSSNIAIDTGRTVIAE